MSHAPSHPTPINPDKRGHAEFEPGHHPGHEHPDFLAHHWDTPQQQFEAGKLGMWLFLATEVLLFGGLFCAYAIWRGNHPELFKYGSMFLDTTMGATNTVVLILSSLTMAWGVTCAQRNQRIGLIICLVLTLMGAAAFMVIKYFEYTHKFHEGWYPGIRFYDKPAHSEMYKYGESPHTGGVTLAPVGSQAVMGGVSATTPATPAQGGTQFAPPSGGGQPQQQPAVGTQNDRSLPVVERTSIPPANTGPRGIAADEAALEVRHIHITEAPHVATTHPLQDPHRPENVHMFFNIYFMMTGLHGIHVLIGMIVIVWLLVRSIKGHFSSEYFTPVDLGGLYWHIVDLIWIFLFPLFYLI